MGMDNKGNRVRLTADPAPTLQKSGKPEKIYKDVIMIIDSKRDNGIPVPFAIWEIADVIHHSRSQVSRILKHLIYLNFVFKLKGGFANRIYKITKAWISVNIVIKQYELYRFVKGRNL